MMEVMGFMGFRDLSTIGAEVIANTILGGFLIHKTLCLFLRRPTLRKQGQE